MTNPITTDDQDWHEAKMGEALQLLADLPVLGYSAFHTELLGEALILWLDQHLVCSNDEDQCEHCFISRNPNHEGRDEWPSRYACHCGWLHEIGSECPPAPVTCTDCGYTHMGVGHWKTNRYGMPVPTGIAKQEMKENGSYEQWLHWHRLAKADAKAKMDEALQQLADLGYGT